MPENDTTDRLIKRYESENARIRRQRNAYKDRLAELEASVASLTKERDDALKTSTDQTAEIEKLNAAIKSAPGDAAKEIERLKAELRARDHRAAFNRLAGEKVRPEALDAAWKLSGWEADGDEVDETKLTEAIAKLVEANGFLAPNGAESDGAESSSQSGRLRNGQSATPPERPLGTGRGAASASANKAGAGHADPFRIA